MSLIISMMIMFNNNNVGVIGNVGYDRRRSGNYDAQCTRYGTSQQQS